MFVEKFSLKNIFDEYVSKKNIFKNKDVLTTKFTPENIPHRDPQIKQIALMLAPILRNEKPSNIFIYGKTGTGKTLVIKNIIENLTKKAEKERVGLKIIYINCKMQKITDTEYRLLAQLISEFGERVPYTGLPTNELYKKFFRHLESEAKNIIIVLDEVDSLIGKIGDEVLYNMTRVNQDLEKTKLTLIGISNNLSFIENLDSRVKSSLSEEEIVFPPYNANQLRDILSGRAKEAFNPAETVSSGVIAKCAALAAQEHGDARKALDLLRVSGEMTERGGGSVISESHVDMAQKKLDTDRFMETIKSQPKQSQAVFRAILDMHLNGEKDIQTGAVYDNYSAICRNAGLTPLTQRRVSDLISELETFGIINTLVTSKGRYGRTRIINISLSRELTNKMDGFLNKEFS
jgi:cell division control protein 6